MSDSPRDHRALLLRSLEELDRLQARLTALERARTEPIAVIGLGCRFPGGGDGPSGYWRLLRDGVDAIGAIPPERWDAAALYDADPQAPWKTHVQQAAFLEHVDGFDASFFNISPREAMSMDPQQRVFLEVAWHALEDAGLSTTRLAGSRTGVFAGVCSNDRQNLQVADLDALDPLYFGVGHAHNILSGRLAYLFDLKGPNIAIDTACSSSLVAVHLACQSLRAGEADIALAGGVNLILSPLSLLLPGKMGLMAADGRSRTFDGRADGMGRGEGCGAVVLRRLSDAVADGDRILAVIRGSAVNQDGRTTSLTAPNGRSQQAVIEQALQNAGIEPWRLSYIETHGTATALGDPIEVNALRAVVGAPRDGRVCALGSVKSNVGHTEAAAGVAGLIKVVLSLQHAQLPAHLHFQQLNPNISLDDTPFFIPTESQSWQAGGEPRVAGVSSFGWSGTNAHVVIEEAPETVKRPDASAGEPIVLPLSARHPEALRALASSYRDVLADESNDASLADIAYTASVRRSHFEHRLALVGHDRAEMIAQLDGFLTGTLHPATRAGIAPADGRRGIVFVFPGQGSQWIGMGRALLSQQVFRSAIERCDEAFRPHVSWSAMAALTGTDAALDLDRIDVIQPLLFAIQVALAALLRGWSIEPDAVVGHSMGEIAAAHVAGALTLDDAARIICRRSRILLEASGRGAMAMVELSREQAQDAIRGYEARVSVAVCNSPRAIVLSGDPTALDAILNTLQAQSVFCRRVKVDVASHSPQMDPLRPALLDALTGVVPTHAAIPLYSTVTGAVADGRDLDADYWTRNLREPVLFSTAVDALVRHGHTVFIELSPHPILVAAIDEGLRAAGASGMAIPTMRREEEERSMLLQTLGTLYVSGGAVDWRALWPEQGQCVSLPSYPFQRERFANASVDAVVANLLAAGRADAGSHLRRAPTKEPSNDGIVSSFYDRLVDQTGDTENDDTHLLTWGIFPQVVDGFSWLRTIFTPKEMSADRQRLAEAQKELRRTLFRSVDFSNVHRVLDFGCGHATDVIQLAEQHPHLSLDGYTISARQAALGDARARARGVGDRVRIHHRDSATDDFPGTYQLILGFEVAGLIRDKAALFSNIERHLAAGGLLILADFVANTVSPIDVPETSTYSSTKAEWGALLAGSHLRLVEGVDVSPEIANCLHDPDYARTLALIAAAQTLDDVTQRSFASYENVYRALRAGIISYVLFHIQRDPFSRVDDLEAINAERLEGLTSWPAIAARRERATTHDATDGWLHEIQWHPTPVAPAVITPAAPAGASPAAAQRGAFWILADRSGVGQAVRARLEAQGETCVTIEIGDHPERLDPMRLRIRPDHLEDFQQLFQAGLPACRVVLHCWSLDAPSPLDATLHMLRAAETAVSVSALHLVQALVRAGLRDAPRLWLITAGAQAVGETRTPIAVAQAPLWGLGGAIVHEHPELRCARFDMSLVPAADEIASLCATVLNDDAEDQIAARGSSRHVARLVRKRSQARTASVGIRPDATYLITGGLSGVGLRTARWMVEQGARHLALVSRSGAAPAGSTDLDIMQAAGADVRIFKADVSSADEMSGVLSHIDTSMPPLRGVVHSAVLLEDGVLMRQTAASIRTVMAPKMDGAWNLHVLTQERPLDFFLLYSSLVSMLGTPGQGNYAAANAFVDALAHHRHAIGAPALAINWPPWTEIGQAASANRAERIASRGLHSVTPEEGMRLLERLMGDMAPVVGVMRLDLRQWRQFYPKAASVPLLSELARKQGAIAPHPGQAARYTDQGSRANAQGSLARLLASLDTGERRRAALETHVQEQLAVVLRLAPSHIDAHTALRSLGFDSLMVVELRNRLELNLGITLSAATVFSYPTIAALVPHLADKMGVAIDTAPAHPTATPAADAEVEEIADALLRELEQQL
jgi:myxalamid-type polyketide synthase MxaE and MxaD